MIAVNGCQPKLSVAWIILYYFVCDDNWQADPWVRKQHLAFRNYIYLYEMVIRFLRGLASIAVVVLVISILWLVLWKFVLEQNPLIREFFDLDKKPNKPSLLTKKDS